MLDAHATAADTCAITDDLRSAYVHTGRDEAFLVHLNRLLKRDEAGRPVAEPVVFTATGETRGIVLVDGAGGGKTSLVHRALSQHPALRADAPDKVRWISVRVPSPATLKSLGLEILRQSGYPEVSESRKRWDIWNLVRQRMQRLGTVVLWIDEAHDLFRANKPHEIEDMLKTLKALMQGDGAVIVILTGIEILWQIASFDDQVKRRYSKVDLPSVSEATDGKLLWRIIEKYSADAGLEPPEQGDLVARLVHASRGRFGRCIENTINAIETALLAGDEFLDVQHFAEAWGMQEGCALGENVFLSPRWSQIDLNAPKRH